MGKRNKKRVGYKPKYKGVRYVTNALLKKYPKRYKSRSDASEVAKGLVGELKSNGIKITGGSAIRLLVDKRKELKATTTLYELPDELLKPKPYYELIDYVDLLGALPELPKVSFSSSIVPVGLPEIVGGNNYDYYDYFVSFVNYIDSLRDLSDNDLYTQEWFIRCTVPKRSKMKVNGVYEYESRIIACDVTGLEISDGYGFDPNDKDKEASDKLEVEKKEVPSVVPPTSEGSSELDKQIELEKLKARNLELGLKSKAMDDAKELLKDKVITFEQYKELIKFN
jgi:hypothetical protein